MSQPVKLSDALVLDARMASEIVDRSIAGQVEFWARLGRAIEPLLQGAQVLSLCRSSAAKPLSVCLENVDTDKGRSQVRDYLQSQPFPHYEPHPDKPGMLIRTEANGTKTIGHFVKREFQPLKKGAARK